MTVPYIEDLDLGQHNRALGEIKTSLHQNVSLSENLFLFFLFFTFSAGAHIVVLLWAVISVAAKEGIICEGGLPCFFARRGWYNL